MSYQSNQHFITSIGWKPDGSVLITGSSDSIVRIWNTSTGALISEYLEHSGIGSPSWSPDGLEVLATHLVGLRRWNAANGNLIATLLDQNGQPARASYSTWNLSSTRIASSTLNTVRIWNTDTNALLYEGQEHDQPINDIQWHPIQDRFVTVSDDGTAKIWDASSATVIETLQSPNNRITHAAWNFDGSKLALAITNGPIEIWDIATTQMQTTLDGRGPLDWNKNTGLLASGLRNPIDIGIWDVTNEQLTTTLTGHTRQVTSVSWRNNDELASGGLDGQLIVWNVNNQTFNIIRDETTYPNRGIYSVAWSPSGDRILSSHGDGLLRIIGEAATCDYDIPASDTATLISTITTANGSGNPTTICLAQDSTYTLTTENNILNGLPIITGNITIEGKNATITRDMNAPDFHFFEVVTGAKLTLNDLTLSNGDVSGDSERGGALMNDGGETTLNNVTFDGNAAGTGGAIDNEDGLVTINDSTFVNNVAAYGGAIDNDPTATTIITGSTFTTNHADFNGGAIHNDGGTLTVSSTAFTTNTADDYGGGIDNDEGDVTLNASTFTSNSSDGGGAIRNDGTLTINAGSAFTTNAANNLGWGGAIYNKSGTTLIINASSFDGNTANLEGGAIRNQGDLTVNTGSSFDGNSAVEYGGAIYNTGGTVDLTGVQITDNTATSKDAGGVYVNSSGSLTITDSTLDGNDSGRRGGGIWSGGGVTLTDVHITNNTAVVEGGGVYGSSGATISAGNSCISGNSSRAVYSPSSTAQNFENNWWGATDGPSGSGSGSGDAVNSNIDYDPFITTSCPLP